MFRGKIVLFIKQKAMIIIIIIFHLFLFFLHVQYCWLMNTTIFLSKKELTRIFSCSVSQTMKQGKTVLLHFCVILRLCPSLFLVLLFPSKITIKARRNDTVCSSAYLIDFLERFSVFRRLIHLFISLDCKNSFFFFSCLTSSQVTVPALFFPE